MVEYDQSKEEERKLMVKKQSHVINSLKANSLYNFQNSDNNKRMLNNNVIMSNRNSVFLPQNTAKTNSFA